MHELLWINISRITHNKAGLVSFLQGNILRRYSILNLWIAKSFSFNFGSLWFDLMSIDKCRWHLLFKPKDDMLTSKVLLYMLLVNILEVI